MDWRLEERSAVAKAQGILVADFYRTWLIRNIERPCYPVHSFNGKVSAIFGQAGRAIGESAFKIEHYTSHYCHLLDLHVCLFADYLKNRN